MSSFSGLIKIGNRAKDLGQPEAANLAFGLALARYFDALWRRNPAPSLYLESEDMLGCEGVRSAYYDLLTIEEGGESLCIPVPILHPFVAFSAAKSARVVKRGCHDGREVREDVPPEEIEELWKQLLDLGDEADFAEVLGKILTDSNWM